MKEVREKVGQRYPILFRFNAEERIESGQTLEDAIMVGRLLRDNGVDALHVSPVTGASWREEQGMRFLAASAALSKDVPAGGAVVLAARMKKETGIPVIAVGKLGARRLRQR